MSNQKRAGPPPFQVRKSPIAGLGVFAVQPIGAGTRLIEYTGERISNAEADRRYDDDRQPHPHTVLFIVDRRTVIDAGVGGNEARYINHSCEPNCESVIEGGRVYIEALRDIDPEEELTYDYKLVRDGPYRRELAERYACHCGAANCRGTMLLPARRKKKARGGQERRGQK
jgi:SET domain-containing protein